MLVVAAAASAAVVVVFVLVLLIVLLWLFRSRVVGSLRVGYCLSDGCQHPPQPVLFACGLIGKRLAKTTKERDEKLAPFHPFALQTSSTRPKP